MKQEDYNKNIYTEYTFTRKYGIDDLKSEYAFHGNSQGDESVSNDINIYKESKGWMSYVFKDIPLIQKNIDEEVLRRKEYNKKYIEELKLNGKFGEEYKQIIEIVNDPVYDDSRVLGSQKATTESYRFDIINIGNNNMK